MTYSPNIQLALDILRDEVKGDIKSALAKMSPEYSMTWMYKKGEMLFPVSRPDFSAEMKDVYAITGRKYDIKKIAEGEGTVMIELIESYPDPKTKEVYRTPLVLVLEIRDGKILRGRHYCDPAVSWAMISEKDTTRAYADTPTILTIEQEFT